jgi:hypothetical protein
MGFVSERREYDICQSPRRKKIIYINKSRAEDPHTFNPDPDLAFYFNANPDRIKLFTLILIRILLFITVMGICYHWSIDPAAVHFENLDSFPL